jgi:hypothetical protein
MNFKERSIYQLPNGRELVARTIHEDKLILYNLSATDFGKYELTDDGRLMLNGQLTAWGTEDLLDTGRIASPDVAAILAEGSMVERDAAHERNV